MCSSDGLFYSSIDADSEGEEGKFYVWKRDELEEILAPDAQLFINYFGIDKDALWEDGKNILFKQSDKKAFATQTGISEKDFNLYLERSKSILLEYRNKRIRPSTDDKILASWNGLMISALVDLYLVSGEELYLKHALHTAQKIANEMMQEDGKLCRVYKKSHSNGNAFLDDYSHVTEAFLKLFAASADTRWLTLSEKLADYCLQHFKDESGSLFWLTSNLDDPLVARSKEIYDNVIPSSNSVLATVFHDLYQVTGKQQYFKGSTEMLAAISQNLNKNATSFTNWGALMLNIVQKFYLVVITGPDAKSWYHELMKKSSYPLKMVIWTDKEVDLSVFNGRFSNAENAIYICVDNVCRLPVHSVDAALEHIGR